MKDAKLLFVRLGGIILALLITPVVWSCVGIKFITDEIVMFLAFALIRYCLFFGDSEMALKLIAKADKIFK